jgi:hypothetical protein
VATGRFGVDFTGLHVQMRRKQTVADFHGRTAERVEEVGGISNTAFWRCVAGAFDPRVGRW